MKQAKLPSKNNLILVLMLCIFPVHFWALFVFLHDFPGYLMRYQPLEIMGIFSYVMAFALLESLIVTSILILLAFLLPRKWFLDHFTSQGFALVSLTVIWLIVAHFWIWLQIGASSGNDTTGIQLDSFITQISVFLWLVTLILALISFSIAIHRSSRLEGILENVMDRFTVPSTLFIVIDLLGILIILMRNWR